jgi:hypothetical protein
VKIGGIRVKKPFESLSIESLSARKVYAVFSLPDKIKSLHHEEHAGTHAYLRTVQAKKTLNALPLW